MGNEAELNSPSQGGAVALWPVEKYELATQKADALN